MAVGLRPGGGTAPMWWAVRAHAGGRWSTDVLPAGTTTWAPPVGTDEIMVSAVDRLGMEGPAVRMRP
jgi:hypothetical protein